jgi:glycosyltransferase involved in cell wall biosynthesis
MNRGSKSLTVVCPVYNEADGLASFHRALSGVLDTLDHDWRIVYVDDGSDDDSAALIEGFSIADNRVGCIRLARNFGKEAALLAGLDHCDADLVVTMDADGQHPSELLPELLAQCTEAVDVVYALRSSRDGEGVVKTLGARSFYGLMGRFGRVDLTPESSDYRVVRRQVVEAFRSLREAHRFNRALFAWLGFEQVAVPYQPPSRPAGASKWNSSMLFSYGVDGLLSFSILPLRLVSVVGAVVALGAFVYGVYIFVKTLFFGDPVAGFPTLMITLLFLAGLQMLALGVIGEYVGRTFQEAKKRPLYVVRSTHPAGAFSEERTPTF